MIVRRTLQSILAHIERIRERTDIESTLLTNFTY